MSVDTVIFSTDYNNVRVGNPVAPYKRVVLREYHITAYSHTCMHAQRLNKKEI